MTLPLSKSLSELPEYGQVLANLKSERVTVLIADSNEVHIVDLLACAYRIERGSVSRV